MQDSFPLSAEMNLHYCWPKMSKLPCLRPAVNKLQGYHSIASFLFLLILKIKYLWKMRNLLPEKLLYSVSLYPFPFPVLFVFPWASVFAMLSPLSCHLSCLIFISSSVVQFFLIHVSSVLCHMYPHLVFVFVFKYPLAKVEVHLFRSCTDADWWRASQVITNTLAHKLKAWLYYISAGLTKNRGILCVCLQEWMCDYVFVCTHTVEADQCVFFSHIGKNDSTVPLKDKWKSVLVFASKSPSQLYKSGDWRSNSCINNPH